MKSKLILFLFHNEKFIDVYIETDYAMQTDYTVETSICLYMHAWSYNHSCIITRLFVGPFKDAV